MKTTRAAGLALIVLSVCAVWAGAVRAHALLVRSVPAADAEMSQAPAAIEMWFSEPLEPGFSTARLLASDGTEADTGAALVDLADPTHLTLPVGQLAPGIYTVAWQTLSQVDGHEWFGSFPFTVLNPDGSRPAGTAAQAAGTDRGELPTPAETAFRWLALLGAMLFLGAPLFRLLSAPDSGRASAEARALAASLSPLAAGAAGLAVLLLLTGNWGQLIVQALRLGGLGTLPQVVLETRTGALALARQLPAAAALWAALGLLFGESSGERGRLLRAGAAGLAIGLAALLAWASLPGDWILLAASVIVAAAGGLAAWRGRPWLALLGLAAGSLAGYSLGSHAAAAAGRGWAVLGDYVHLLAAGAWIGGLLLMPWLLVRERERLKSAEFRLAVWQLARRYSYLASFSVFVLAVTGLFNSLVELPDLASLWTTAYGRVLMAKLAVIGAALLLALLNNRLVHGRRRTFQPGQVRALQRQVMAESGVALVLMLTVAVLVQTPVPRAQSPGSAGAFQPALPFNTTLAADDLFIHAQVSPNTVGDNRFWLHLYREAGTPVGDVQLVRLRFNYQDAPLGQASVDLEPLGRGTFQAEGAYLSQAGAWEVEAYVRRRGLDDVLARFSLDVPAPAGSSASGSPWTNPVPAVPGLILAAGAFLALGVMPMIWRRPLASAGPRWYSAMVGAGLGALVLAFGLSAAGAPAWREQLAARQAQSMANPIPDTPESRAQGQALYEQNCLPCHGPAGLGDGPVGLTLRPPPANLQVHMVPGAHTDAQLFSWITDGYPNSAMPAFRDVLTEEERWHVLNYIRTLAPPE